jgi:hypothetical protein
MGCSRSAGGGAVGGLRVPRVLTYSKCAQVARADFFLKMLPCLDGGDDVGMVLSPQSFSNLRPHADIFNHGNVQFWEYAQHGYDAIGFISCTGAARRRTLTLTSAPPRCRPPPPSARHLRPVAVRGRVRRAGASGARLDLPHDGLRAAPRAGLHMALAGLGARRKWQR